ncbi:methylisocitrate lyase [Natronoglycomyces albus]|uniref:Methylisocitrate lyase n=1 Tax=Natronoglycomyces albus TaxID=2811108 RepID=A0A895XPD5_9ACTN|nr:methylisocitrate lyase [Natronoglycomyces albus]QSB04150.1 methylisocitrate lyase [Natronoglycomyces albus]
MTNSEPKRYVSPTDKRRQFRAQLASGQLIRFPGAFSPLVARAVEDHGFEGVYVSGAVLSTDLALPDIGLTTLTEVALRGQQIARVTDLPTIIDADTGFGEPANVARTINAFEEGGLAGCHLEDQVNPKRCGHLDNKQIVATDEMVRKVRAAVKARRDPSFVICARTDARTSEGLDAAIERAKAYVDAGADMLFPEALQTEEEMAAFRKAVDVPLLANMTEFGKTPLLTTTQLENLGYNLVIWPVTSWRSAMGAVDELFDTLKATGHQEPAVERMQTRKRLYELVRYSDYNEFDQALFNFEVPGRNQ